ncbi:hypothetical protein PENARI_c079G01113 [Penicillium arizonense]|uniref:Uncharacterized protein n=1 Tax=Penicillium arizonense TaxID=1835702 RepID=A0A1F5L1C1_PENAI|nr:hypothetical protein PENARI_c079G01113 [Penicillium arizonense]OGE46995.1 hypothetical protein PENARI_c079G01113 [Penicillium arizonense]
MFQIYMHTYRRLLQRYLYFIRVLPFYSDS